MNTRPLKIAAGGSAANPPHNGHLYLIERIGARYEFDKIIWIPSGNGYKDPIESKHRVAMTERLGIPSCVQIRYDEIFLGWRSTCAWFMVLEKEYPGAEITWVTGSDSIIEEWDDGDYLLSQKRFLVIKRQNYEYRYAGNANFIFDPTPIVDINSTEIRDLIKAGNKTWRNLVPPPVADYIEDEKLYL